jgi:hypothetical protein
VPSPKLFVLNILIPKFFENRILRGPFLRNPRWAWLLGISKEKIDLDICSRKPMQATFASCGKSLFR